MPLISSFIKSEDDYFRKKEISIKAIRKFLRRYSTFRDITVNLNTLDQRGRGLRGIYLTAARTSAEGLTPDRSDGATA